MNQRYGGFFTGAFVGLAAVDLSGYDATAEFVDFDYRELDAKILSDDYVNQRYGGFFTGAFVGLAAVDLSGYDATAEFVDFDYRELSE